MKKFPEQEDPFMERYEAALSRGKGKSVEVPMPCAACSRTMRTKVPFITANQTLCRVVNDELEILEGENWFSLCEECAGQFDLTTLRPVERHGVSAETEGGEDAPDNVIELPDEEEGDVLYYYFECAHCGDVITEKELFTRLEVDRVVYVHKHLLKKLEELRTLEFCSACAERHDFKKVVLRLRRKKIARVFSFDTVYGDAFQKVSIRQWLD